ncbi:hypothetical protein JVU11DRAFT_4358 [Chiua virens]|nr:hypothetical protein JVU11DRAFT_4358 [Chiua virens]
MNPPWAARRHIDHRQIWGKGSGSLYYGDPSLNHGHTSQVHYKCGLGPVCSSRPTFSMALRPLLRFIDFTSLGWSLSTLIATVCSVVVISRVVRFSHALKVCLNTNDPCPLRIYPIAGRRLPSRSAHSILAPEHPCPGPARDLVEPRAPVRLVLEKEQE